MTKQPIQGKQSMNGLRQNIFCSERREKQRRKARGMEAYSSGTEPNPFSRRMGIERRGMQ